MTQRNILENSINLANTLRGPAKILYGPGTLPFPVNPNQVINATTGAAATGWTSFGVTRGGINVNKTIDQQVYDDLDQILGAYDQSITDRSYVITSQIAEVLDRTQMGLAWDMGVASVVSTAGATMVLVPLDDTDNKTTEYRLAVVFPKVIDGRTYMFVFRRASLSGGDKTMRFDKSDPASPPFEMRAFPEIATTISPDQAWGVLFDTI